MFTVLGAFLLTAPAAALPVVPPWCADQTGVDADWACLRRYRDSDRVLSGAGSPDRVVFMGDSITQAWGKQAFFKQRHDFIDRGIAGQTAAQMLLRFRSDVIALKPAVVHIMAGTNDIAENEGRETLEEIFGYIVDMVELAQSNHIEVILASTPPTNDFPWRRGLMPARAIRALNQRLEVYARAHGVSYVDYWSILAAPDGGLKTDYSSDRVHPNAAGYGRMQPLAERAILRALIAHRHAHASPS